MAARNQRNKVYSVYHRMEEKGLFETNPANAGAIDGDGNTLYKGPIPYPKMIYHPKGEMEVVVQGIVKTDRENNPVLDKNGEITYTGRVYGVKHRIVNSEEEENHPDNFGWHKTEGEARRVNPTLARTAPPKSQLELKDEEIARLKEALAEQAKTLPVSPKSGVVTRSGTNAS